MKIEQDVLKTAAANAPTPIPSATVLLIRDGLNGLEVFMVVRHHRIDFASGALVFPGGKVTDEDQDPNLERFSTHQNLAEMPMVFAAIRETFEESGFLLAKEKNGEEISKERLQQLAPYRKMLADGEISLLEFLEKEHLVTDTASLVHFAHWITPEFIPKRFDTHFYLIKVPEGQTGEHDGTESVDSVWIAPDQALEDYQKGERTIVFPTRMNILKLSRFKSVKDAIQETIASSVKTILPWVEDREEGQFLCISKDAGYTQTEDSLEIIFKMGG